ncbi:MAG: hypothetical protein AAFV49_23785, partial [Pseudomonadota bacterium]
TSSPASPKASSYRTPPATSRSCSPSSASRTPWGAVDFEIGGGDDAGISAFALDVNRLGRKPAITANSVARSRVARLHVFEVTLPSRQQQVDLPSAMLFGPDSESDAGLLEDFGLSDIQVEEHQGINDVSFALAIDTVREYSSATRVWPEGLDDPFSHRRRRH